MTRIPTLKPLLATPSTAGWKPDSERGSRHARGYGWMWEQTRARIRERDKGLCQPCRRKGIVRMGTQCDHIVSKAEARALGWTEEQIEADANLQWIDDDCHREKTARESQGGGGSSL